MNRSITRNSGFAVIPPQPAGSALLYEVMQYQAECEDEDSVCTFFFSVQTDPANPVPIGVVPDYQLIMTCDWQYRKGVATAAFDLLQGATVRIPASLCVARLLYLGGGPGFFVSAAKVDDVTNASQLQLTQRITVVSPGGSVPVPVPAFASSVRLTSDVQPRSLLVFFKGSLDVAAPVISTDVVSQPEQELPIPNGAAFIFVADLLGTPVQRVSVITPLQL